MATLGTFDGVHLGHKKIIEKLLAHTQAESLLLTFFPHPRMVLQEGNNIKLLNTLDEKAQLLASTGLDYLIIHPFDRSFSELSAEEFVRKVLVEKFNISKIIIGHDHKFGKNRSADINDLIEFGKLYGFEVEQIPAQEIDDVSISSTKIRNALQDGNIQTANEYLGYNYFLTGEVVKGRQLGRTIGFPTANISIDENYKLIPVPGVYVVQSEIDGKNVQGMMNIGTNPTVGGTHQTIEINFLDFSDDLYGRTLKVELLDRIRNEEKFASLDELKHQLAKDREATTAYFSAND